MPSIGETPAAAKDAKNIQWDEGESNIVGKSVFASGNRFFEVQLS